MNAHVDVAAYALGVLDESDASRFEEHLAGCAECAAELESLLPVVGMMSEVNVADLMDVDTAFGQAYDPRPVEDFTAPVRDGSAEPGLRAVGNPVLPPGPTERPVRATGAIPLPVRTDRPGRPGRAERPARRRGRGRAVLGLAAAASVLGVLTAGGVLNPDGLDPNGWFGDKPPGQAQADPPTTTEGTLPEGDRFEATDADTGVEADVALAGKPWGTRVSFEVTKVEGPRTCRLVAVTASGDTEVLSTWKVPDTGYGTEAQPKPLALEASTALTPDDIAELRVEDVEADGGTTPLVTVET